MFKFRFLAPLALTALLVSGCALKRAPVLVGQTALGSAQSIHQLQTGTKQLADAHIITINQALVVENALLQANDSLRPVPALLRAIDAAEKANKPDQNEVTQALAFVTSVSAQLKVVVANIPVSDATKQILDLVAQTQQTYATLLANLNKLKQ